jgi:serine/threonine protein kinase
MKGLDCCEDANFGSHQAGKWLGANVAIEKADDDRHDAVAELWTQLNHPNILKLYGTCCVDNRVFFVCESVDSDKWDDLREHLLGRPTEVWGKLYQVALGVLYLHQHRISHGDLMCSNIFVARDGKPKLAGLRRCGRVEQHQKARHPSSRNAVAWEAPERLEGGEQSLWSDIYSLGMCILEAVTGQPPWGYLSDDAIQSRVLRGELPRRPRELSDSHWNLVQSMCCLDAAKRTPMNKVVQELRRLAGEADNSFSSHDHEEFLAVASFEVPLQRHLLETAAAVEQCTETLSMNRKILARMKDILHEIETSDKLPPRELSPASAKSSSAFVLKLS